MALASGLEIKDTNPSLGKLLDALKQKANEKSVSALKSEVIPASTPIQEIHLHGLEETSHEPLDVTTTVDGKTVGETKISQVSEPKKEAVQDTGTVVSDKNDQKKSVSSRIALLSDLNGSGVIDTEGKDFVSEARLKKALSRADKNGGGLDVVYDRVVGSAPDWGHPAETVKKFHEALRVSMSVIRQLTGGNAGLDAFLEGKTELFFAAVQKRVAANGGKPLEVTIDNPNTLPPAMYNTIGVAATVGVALITSGVVMVGSEKHTMNAEDFMKEVQSSTEKTFGDKALGVLNYIKEAFMGRRLSLTFGRERVEDYKKNIVAYTGEVMKLTPETKPEDIKDEELKTAFSTALRVTKAAKMDIASNFQTIQKALIQSYIIGEGFKNEGSNWSGSIGLLMFL